MSSGDQGSSEKRDNQRQSVTLLVEYEGADDLIGDYTDNLSTGGAFISTTKAFEVGDDVQLVLSFPGLLEPIQIATTVRWTRSGDAETAGVGLAFTEYGESRTQLETLLNQIKSRDPAVVNRLVRILVVEDNPHVAKLIRTGLQGSVGRAFGDGVSFNFRTASNGREALDLLGKEVFDALIIDVYMPILDGTTVIEEVRADERIKTMPIIAVSAGGERAREFAMGAGADIFLSKPMRLRQIVTTMQDLLNLDS